MTAQRKEKHVEHLFGKQFELKLSSVAEGGKREKGKEREDERDGRRRRRRKIGRASCRERVSSPV